VLYACSVLHLAVYVLGGAPKVAAAALVVALVQVTPACWLLQVANNDDFWKTISFQGKTVHAENVS
jgi:hypothetical protein